MSSAVSSAADDAPRRPANSPAIVVQQSGLPVHLGELVLAVTGKCRLWRNERTEVARELCAHFLDGIDAGATPQDLASSFGDPRRAAKLITATRKKLRPVWWRSSRTTMRAVGIFLLLCMLVYGVLAARFFMFSPNVKRNFMRELNAPLLNVPAADRAWPGYVEAKRQFGPLPKFMTDSDTPDPRWPGDDGWELMAKWLETQAGAMQTLRSAAAKPLMGYEYRGSTDPDLARAIELTNPGYKYDPSVEPNPENPMVVGILLPHLGEMRKFARWLRSDASLAASLGDGERFLADIDAMLGLAAHARQDKFLISDQVAISIADLTFSTIAREAAAPDLLSAAQLRDLAHQTFAFAEGRIHIDPTTEMMIIEDILQRFYSDDGNGDGHFVGGPDTDRLYSEWGAAKPKLFPFFRAMQPVQSVFIASRAEVNRLADRFVAAAMIDDELPPWRHTERNSDKAYLELMHSGIYSAMPFLSSLQGDAETGPMERACTSRDTMETRRDVALVVLAMESYRRSHGRWPEKLAQLVPDYLPRVPLDPFDGRPLRYVPAASASERPVIYSVGVDAIDDGGAAPDTEAGRFAVHNFRWFGVDPSTVLTYGVDQQKLRVSRGDWVLWPPLPLDAPATGTEDANVR